MLNIEIIYCAVWGYAPRAVSLTGLLLNKCPEAIQALTLIPSDGGKFEVSVNGNLIYSKLATGRHADPDEVLDAVKAII